MNQFGFLGKKITIDLRKVSILALSLFLLLALSYTLFLLFPTERSTREETIFQVKKGESTTDIAEKLGKQNLIRSPFIFRFYILITGQARNLKAGEYFLSRSMSLPTVIRKFTQGSIIKEEITVVEGWGLKNIAAEFEERGFFTAQEFFAITGTPGQKTEPMDFSQEFPFLKNKPALVSLEGYLFPDTYQLTKSDTPEDVVRRMLANFEEKVGDSVSFDILTMASILEKEVASLQDMKIVSGILWKRIENNMRLQVDATVVYIREGNYKIVSIDETEIESPYNTYRNYGLPPGPISNPGLDSIQAALNPTKTSYWFYLSPSPTRTIFSQTFEQHKAAKVLYLQ